MSEHFDAIVIGMAPGGETVAKRLIAAGKRVAVVEKELIGGECPYRACMSSKTLLRPVEASHAAGVGTPALSARVVVNSDAVSPSPGYLTGPGKLHKETRMSGNLHAQTVSGLVGPTGIVVLKTPLDMFDNPDPDTFQVEAFSCLMHLRGCIDLDQLRPAKRTVELEEDHLDRGETKIGPHLS